MESREEVAVNRLYAAGEMLNQLKWITTIVWCMRVKHCDGLYIVSILVKGEQKLSAW